MGACSKDLPKKSPQAGMGLQTRFENFAFYCCISVTQTNDCVVLMYRYHRESLIYRKQDDISSCLSLGMTFKKCHMVYVQQRATCYKLCAQQIVKGTELTVCVNAKISI